MPETDPLALDDDLAIRLTILRFRVGRAAGRGAATLLADVDCLTELFRQSAALAAETERAKGSRER